MCYTGKCEYEITSGDFVGDCSLPRGAVIPDDAGCVIAEQEQEIAGLEEALGEIGGFEFPDIKSSML